MEENNLIDISTDSGVTIISFRLASISGVSGLEQLSNELRNYITDNKPKEVVVDFLGVKFFSSQMLGLLVDMWRKITEYEGVLLISGINPQLSRVFKITNLDKIFQFCPDRQTAVKRIKDKRV